MENPNTKAINPAGNNIYGNDGYLMFATAPTSSGAGAGASSINPFTFSGSVGGGTTVTPLNVFAPYVSSFAGASGFTNVSNTSGNANFDNPTAAGGSLRSGVGFESENNILDTGTTNEPIFSFTLGGTVPASFKVGLFFTTSGGITSGAGLMGGGVTTPVTATKSVANDGALEALFFSITGGASDQTYTVVVSGPGGGLFGDNNIDIMGITFDSTPEPATFAGCAVVSLALIWLSRRRKKAVAVALCLS